MGKPISARTGLNVMKLSILISAHGEGGPESSTHQDCVCVNLKEKRDY